MPKRRIVSAKQEQEWNYLIESQLQLIQLHLTMFKEHREHYKEISTEMEGFVMEVYGISKTSLGLLIPLFVSTYAYPVIPNIQTIRFYIGLFILFFIAMILINLKYIQKRVKAGEKARDAQTELLLALSENINALQKSRNVQIKKLHKKV